jgi:hypothetical protein
MLTVSLARAAAEGQSSLTNDDCTTYSTNLQTNGDGYLAFLDRHEVNCGAQQSMVSQFQLVNVGDQIKYTYKCCHPRDGQQLSDHYTNWDKNPNAPHDKGVNWLDRHHVDCGTTGLAEFQLQTQGSGGSAQVRYHYKCGSRYLGPCTVKSNPFTGEGDDREINFLDRQNVDCDGQLLAGFQLNSQYSPPGGGAGSVATMSYQYTCCQDQPSAQDWPTFTSDSALAASPWATYLRSLYGELKTGLSEQNPLTLSNWWCFYIDKMAAASVNPPQSVGTCPTAANAPEGQRCESGMGFELWDAGCGMRDVGCRMRDAGRGMWDAGCGMRDAGRGIQPRPRPRRKQLGGQIADRLHMPLFRNR